MVQVEAEIPIGEKRASISADARKITRVSILSTSSMRVGTPCQVSAVLDPALSSIHAALPELHMNVAKASSAQIDD